MCNSYSQRQSDQPETSERKVTYSVLISATSVWRGWPLKGNFLKLYGTQSQEFCWSSLSNWPEPVLKLASSWTNRLGQLQHSKCFLMKDTEVGDFVSMRFFLLPIYRIRIVMYSNKFHYLTKPTYFFYVSNWSSWISFDLKNRLLRSVLDDLKLSQKRGKEKKQQNPP